MERNYWNQKLSGPQKEEALKMVRDGMSANSVAEFYGVSRQYISEMCLRRGFRISKKTPLGSVLSEEQESRQRINQLVLKAISKGVLIPEPCEVCGIFGKDEKGKRMVHAHHDNYNKPLEVRWLCQKHHMEWHKNNQPIKLLLT